MRKRDEEENPLARRTYPMTVERDLAGPSVRKPVRAEQIDGTVKSEEQILSELYEHFLEQEKKNLASGIEYAKTIPPRYPPGGYLEFRGARILGEVWERLWRKAEADALQDVADRHAKRAFQSGPERQVDWHKVEEPISPRWHAEWKRTRTSTAPREPSELMGVEAASDVVVRTMADAFEADEKMRKPVRTGTP